MAAPSGKVESDRAAPARVEALLDRVAVPVASASVTLASGRTYEIESGSEADALVIRGRGGDVVLRIEVGESGPVLSFSGAELRLTSSGPIALEGSEIALRSRGAISVESAGSLTERIGGDHHTAVSGDERLEATNVEVLAETGHVELLAEQAVRIDGEHVGLNNKTTPTPFAWSRLAAEVDE